MLWDLHLHSGYSPCSGLDLGEALERAARLGLGGICVTDHHSREAAAALPRAAKSGPVVLVGQECSTTRGDMLVFGVDQVLEEGLRLRDLLKRVEEAGGVAVAAHPFRRGHAFDHDAFRERPVVLLEGMNGRSSPEENLLALSWGSRLGLAMTGGSDAHCLEEVGRVVTLLPEGVRSMDRLVAALKAGNCRPTLGPAAGAPLPAEPDIRPLDLLGGAAALQP